MVVFTGCLGVSWRLGDCILEDCKGVEGFEALPPVLTGD